MLTDNAEECPRCGLPAAVHRQWGNAVETLGIDAALHMLRQTELDCPEDAFDGPQPIAWNKFWQRTDHPEWLIEPLLPEGRLVALYSKGGKGKSLLALEIAAAAATGTPTLYREAGAPLEVVYLDMEMTPDDLWERLLEFGYTQDTDLRHLHYYQLQQIPPLDTEAGGEALGKIVRRHQARLVVIDTLGRVTEGEENAADTYQDMYRHSFQGLKEYGTTVLRLDHEGKSARKGQRGSSAKNDDVDVVWRLKAHTDGTSVVLVCDKRRAGWIPDMVTLHRINHPLRHTVAATALAPNTIKLIETMNRLQIPPTMSRRNAAERLHDIGITARNEDLGAAIRWRRQNPNRVPGEPYGTNTPLDPPPGPISEDHGTTLWDHDGTTPGDQPETQDPPQDEDGTIPGTTPPGPDTPPPSWDQPPPLKGAVVPGAPIGSPVVDDVELPDDPTELDYVRRIDENTLEADFT